MLPTKSKLPSHLGGHSGVTHIDKVSPLYLAQRYHIRTAVDVGCGPGGMVQFLRDCGIDAFGIDGDFTLPESPQVVVHDFTDGPLVADPVDLA